MKMFYLMITIYESRSACASVPVAQNVLEMKKEKIHQLKCLVFDHRLPT